MTAKPTPEAINLLEIKRFDDKERRKMQNELADIIQFYDGFLADFIRYGWQPRGEWDEQAKVIIRK